MTSLSKVPSRNSHCRNRLSCPFFNNPIYVNLFLTVGLLVISFLLGGYLSRALRMADYGWKIAVIILATLASIVVVYRGWPPKLGVDLGGGVILVYQVDPEKVPSEGFDIQKLISSVGERVNPGGQKEITVRPLGNDKIQITIPQVGEEEARRDQEHHQPGRNASNSASWPTSATIARSSSGP